ncbi:unnamed protein product, partial [Polarella glacialis]
MAPHEVPLVTEDLCAYCFEVLLAELQGVPRPSLRLPELSGGATSWYSNVCAMQVPGLFVTWNTSDGRLRGCMGALQPLELERGLADFAVKSSLGDRRFRPVSLEEVWTLTCRVSILHSFETCRDALDWEVGPHGVHIAFTATSGKLCPCSTASYS